jgi:hypothetical protein
MGITMIMYVGIVKVVFIIDGRKIRNNLLIKEMNSDGQLLMFPSFFQKHNFIYHILVMERKIKIFIKKVNRWVDGYPKKIKIESKKKVLVHGLGWSYFNY